MRAHFTLFLVLLPLCTSPALARTPDGQPPSEETVCDNETGAAYGLCNAYCEAMDCDSDDPHASENACSKVRSKFQQITGRDLPCEAPTATCPCLAEPIFTDILTHAGVCTDLANGVNLTTIINLNQGAIEAVSAPAPKCSWNLRGVGSGSLSITPEEATACIQVMHDQAAELGLPCN